jgi:hypothetical protein
VHPTGADQASVATSFEYDGVDVREEHQATLGPEGWLVR